MSGAFQTNREVFEHPIWQDVTKFRIFFYIYGMAVYSPDGVRYGDILIKRGQYLRSFRNLSKDLEFIENRKVKSYSLSTVKRTIDKLVKENRLLVEDTELGTLFTVVNYEHYQGFGSFKKDTSGTQLEQGWNTDGTELEHSRNNKKKDNKDNKKDSRPKRVYDTDSIPYKFALLLFEGLRKNLPDMKEPNLNNWADDFRKLIEIDNKKPEHIEMVIKWTQEHHFWWKNVMSGEKFRKQYERLAADYRAEKQKVVKPKVVPMESRPLMKGIGD